MTTNTANIAPGYISTDDAASYLGLHPITISAWRKRAQGPAYIRVGRLIKYRIKDLDAWAETHRVNPGKRKRGRPRKDEMQKSRDAN